MRNFSKVFGSNLRQRKRFRYSKTDIGEVMFICTFYDKDASLFRF